MSFVQCNKITIHIDALNLNQYKNQVYETLKQVKHHNLHVVLESEVSVSDEMPDWYDNENSSILWTQNDVQTLVSLIAISSAQTLTCVISQTCAPEYLPKVEVTFKCNQKLSLLFMKFLKTQRIYCGDKDEAFLTLDTTEH